ncbi:MAG: hypothetical protein IJ105_03550 [Bacilli bacterium]|nr:hypothetical protein [Bacilli bacterium]
MKNRLLLFLILFILIFTLFGCTFNKEQPKKETKKIKIENEKDTYIKYIQKLKKIKETSEDLPFTVEVKYEKMDDEVRYQVIIDNPTNNITDVKALAVHNKQTDDVFPSVGIFDKKVKLIPNKKPSGVILVGYIPYEGDIDNLDVEIKVLISYKIDNKSYTSYYVTKK